MPISFFTCSWPVDGYFLPVFGAGLVAWRSSSKFQKSKETVLVLVRSAVQLCQVPRRSFFRVLSLIFHKLQFAVWLVCRPGRSATNTCNDDGSTLQRKSKWQGEKHDITYLSMIVDIRH